MDNAVLYALLSAMGYSYSAVNGDAHLTMVIGDMRWNMVLHAALEAFVIYSRFPYTVFGGERALEYCNHANGSLLEGALVLDKNRALVRTTAWRSDDFYAKEQLQQAVDRNIAIVVKHWAGLYKVAVKQESLQTGLTS